MDWSFVIYERPIIVTEKHYKILGYLPLKINSYLYG